MNIRLSPFLFFMFCCVMATPNATAQTTFNGSFEHGGITRTYSYYVPASYVPGNPVPMVIGLHGTGSSGDDFAQYRDFRPIADTAGFIVVNPDGSTMFGIKFWNYGSVLGSTVDDVGFLEALVDTLSSHYSIDAQRVYCTGMSNGSFMAYYLACESNRFAAVAGVTGSMSYEMLSDCDPAHPTPTLHIHGTDDSVNPYEGTSTMVGIDEMSRFWVDHNNCDTVPAFAMVPDTDPGDGATAEHYVYTGGIDGNTVELFKVIGGEHSWPGSPMPTSSDVTCMDFEASREIWRFFSQYTLITGTNDQAHTVTDLKTWPNPAGRQLNISGTNVVVTNVVIMDLQGRVVQQASGANIQSVDVGQIEPGHYVAALSGKDFCVVKKLVVNAGG